MLLRRPPVPRLGNSIRLAQLLAGPIRGRHSLEVQSARTGVPQGVGEASEEAEDEEEGEAEVE